MFKHTWALTRDTMVIVLGSVINYTNSYRAKDPLSQGWKGATSIVRVLPVREKYIDEVKFHASIINDVQSISLYMYFLVKVHFEIIL